MTNPFLNAFAVQTFTNEYELVDGVVMHSRNPEHFQIPPDVIKRNVRAGQFVELRIDSPRFSRHDNTTDRCACPNCNGEMTKPILRHNQPATLLSVPTQNIPSRGWGEDFWVCVEKRLGDVLMGIVDNPLIESRLHGLHQGDTIYFREQHILMVHDSHRLDL
ncbi:MAG: hypothetical protein R3C20_24860 [Planctomycetaceae bacterium]